MMELFLQQFLSILIRANAQQYALEPDIVASIIYQESVQGSESLLEAIAAYRYEQGFFTRYILGKKLTGYVPQGIHKRSERQARATSWGLMQIMGSTGREMGFKGRFMPELLFPWNNIQIGCKYLAHLLKQEGNYVNALRRYNGSLKNPKTAEYADKILQHVEEGRFKRILIEI